VRPAVLAVLLATLAACHPRVGAEAQPRSQVVRVGESTVRVVYWPGDERGARQVIAAVSRAVPRVARWGGLEAPVTITVHATHEELEAAVGRQGYAWLRAWARYATVYVQSPTSWGLLGAKDRQVEELLVHELTHCVMYQRSATEWTWSYKGIPLWFREGLASVTAEQDYRRGSVEDLWAFYQQGLPGSGDGAPGRVARVAQGKASALGDPLSDPEPLYQESSDVVYGASHHAFRFLLDRYGDAKAAEVMSRMRGGRTWARAFEETYGISDAEFAAEFRRYVLWQGWRIERQ
jgi:hypothetical protein